MENKKRTLKKFNKTIRVEVSLDSIAQKLFDSLKDDVNKHLITEQIIGVLDNVDRIDSLYNALNGVIPTIDFSVGDPVLCEEKYHNGKERVTIGEATVVEIDEFARNSNVKVQYSAIKLNSEGEPMKSPQERFEWVNSKYLTHIDYDVDGRTNIITEKDVID